MKNQSLFYKSIENDIRFFYSKKIGAMFYYIDFTRKLIKALIRHPELVKSQYRNLKNPLFGHCYVASEVFYHLGKKEQGFYPCCMKIKEGTHWFLKDDENTIIDITTQDIPLPKYWKAKRRAFLTKQPSKRAQIIIDEIKT